MTELEQCETIIGTSQCGREAGHEPPCIVHTHVELSPELGKLLAFQLEVAEQEATLYRKLRKSLKWTFALNLGVMWIYIMLIIREVFW